MGLMGVEVGRGGDKVSLALSCLGGELGSCVACRVMFISNYIFSTIQRRQKQKQESTASSIIKLNQIPALW